ncbi:aldehyde dehydrogenase (NAD+) mitochondrial [Fusarium sp. NRRL 52700]|nr:aldehyde dehydrogenase (NAD+) mitochondrial [Fusarium sp. NRRL 52700]
MEDFTKFVNTVNGTSVTGEVTQGTDPSTRKKLWDVPVASSEDIENAISAAKTAFKQWSKTSWSERQNALLDARDVLIYHKPALAQLITKEGGKPIQFATMEVEHSINFLQFNANQEPLQEQVIQDDDELRLTIREKPLGVIAAICPWNYPLVLSIAKVAAALITGNTIIVKPSPFTPYSILKVVELLQGVFPAGVLQALNGDDKLGPTLCQHPGVDKITFTGSTATGKKIAQVAGNLLKPVTLELGGNSASIVCPDVDPKIVAPQVALGSFMNSGQLCVASKRVFVHEDIYDEFLETMLNTVKEWKNEMQYDIVKSFFQDSIDNGHCFALGEKPNDSGDSFVIKPAIIDNPPDDALVVTHEAFGPIVPLMKWKTEDEVIERANNTLSGLGGAVWSKDVENAQRLADRIEAGTIWINSFEKPLPQAHLAGHKESGVGGEWGRRGLGVYCQPQVIHCYKSRV